MKNIVVGIIKKNQQVLIVRRKVNEGDLMWQFPGGEIEENESAFEAVQREVKEETNIICLPTRLIGERLHPYTSRYMYYIACSYESGIPDEIVDNDIEEAIWANINDLNKYFTTDLYSSVDEYLKMK